MKCYWLSYIYKQEMGNINWLIIKKASDEKWLDKFIKSVKTCCYEIRAYKVTKKIYGKFSSVKK